MTNSKQPKATKWTNQQKRFIEWVATPEELREHRKLHDYADYMGINRVTLWKWRNLPGFNEEVQAYCKMHLGNALPDVLATLKEMAMRGSFQHQKLYLELLGFYTNRTVIDIRVAAERIAEEMGVPVSSIVEEADRILQDATSVTKEGR